MASTPTQPSAKVFLDSSVLIAAAISPRGRARDLINAGLDGHVTLFLSPVVVTECERNLSHKAPDALPLFRLFLEALAPEMVRPSREQILEVARIVELKDAPIVAAARTARADILVTYDRKHLLANKDVIHEHFQVVVATPDDTLRLLGFT